MKKTTLLIVLIALVIPWSNAQDWKSKYEEVSFIGERPIVTKNDKFGFVDINGKEITPVKYSGYISFNEGMAAVKIEDKWGFIDTTGKEIIPIIYDEVDSFISGKAKVTKYGETKYINTKGEFLEFSKLELNGQLLKAVQYSDFDFVKLLIIQGADVNYTDVLDANLLMYAAMYSDINMVKYLVEKGIDVKKKGVLRYSKNGTYGSSLVVASGEGKLDIVKYLIETCKLDINESELDSDGGIGWSALQTAVGQWRIDVVEYLILKGANINYQYHKDGFTALTYAITYKQRDIIKLLVEKGADLNIKSTKGCSLLHIVIDYYHEDIKGNDSLISYLLNKGCNVNIQDNDGETALMYAVKNNMFSTVKILCENKADRLLKNNSGETALDIANKSSFPNKYFIQYLNNPDTKIYEFFQNDFVYTLSLFIQKSQKEIEDAISDFKNHTTEEKFDKVSAMEEQINNETFQSLNEYLANNKSKITDSFLDSTYNDFFELSHAIEMYNFFDQSKIKIECNITSTNNKLIVWQPNTIEIKCNNIPSNYLFIIVGNDTLRSIDGKYVFTPNETKKIEFDIYFDTKLINKNESIHLIKKVVFEAVSSENKYQVIKPLSDNWHAVKTPNKYGLLNSMGKVICPVIYDSIGYFPDDNGFAFVSKENKWGFIDTTGKEVIPLNYDGASDFNNGYAKVKIGDKWGYIDKNGIKIIQFQFNEASDFSEGLAGVKKEDKWGFINEKGKEVIPFIFEQVNSFYKGFVVVYDNAKCGIIDKKGNIIIPLKYDIIEPIYLDNSVCLARVALNDKWGVIDKKGKEIIPLIYDYIEGNYNDRYSKISKNENKIGIIDIKTGKIVWDPQFSDVNLYIGCVGLASVDKNNKYNYGLINMNGKEITTMQSNYHFYFEDGLSKVENGDKIGYIDTTGKVIIPIQYDYASYFNKGIALVNRNDTSFLIDKKGKELVAYPYFLKDYDEFELLKTYNGDNGNFVNVIKIKKDEKWGIIDTKGKLICQVEYDNVSNFFDGFAIVKKGGKFGFVNIKGKEICKTEYDDVRNFNNGFAEVKKGNKWGAIDTTGKETCPILFDEIKTSLFDKIENSYIINIGKWGIVNAKGEEICKAQYDEVGDFNNGFAKVKKDNKWGFVDTTGKEVIPIIYDSAENFENGKAKVTKDGKTFYFNTKGECVGGCEW